NVPLLATRYGLLDGSTLALTQGDEPPAPAGPAQVLDLGFDLEARLVTLEGPLARPVVQRHGEKPAVVAPTVGTAECYAVACRPDGRLLAVSCDDHVIRLWDMPDGRERWALFGHVGPVWGLAFASDRRTLASASADGTVRLWDTITKRELLVL